MANEYTTLSKQLDSAEAEAFQAYSQLLAAQSTIATVLATLTGLPTKYPNLSSDIDALVTADPTNTAKVNLQDRKNAVVADFTNYKTLATNLNTAASGVAL